MNLSKRAFTLIEVLIAMVIISLLLTTGIFAFKLSINSLSKQKSVTFNEVMIYAQLKELFSSTYFYVIKKNKIFEVNDFDYIYFYKKNKKEITFVSDGAIFSDELSLINLKIKDNNLYYKESKIYDKKNNYKNPFFYKEKEYLLIKNIQDAEFTYERPYDFDINETISIPKLVFFSFIRDNKKYKFIFDTKFSFYKLNKYLKYKNEIF